MEHPCGRYRSLRLNRQYMAIQGQCIARRLLNTNSARSPRKTHSNLLPIYSTLFVNESFVPRLANIPRVCLCGDCSALSHLIVELAEARISFKVFLEPLPPFAVPCSIATVRFICSTSKRCCSQLESTSIVSSHSSVFMLDVTWLTFLFFKFRRKKNLNISMIVFGKQRKYL